MAPPRRDVVDRDFDGKANAADRCPDDPEIYNGFEDEDGCPDPDAFAGVPMFTDNLFVLRVLYFPSASASLDEAAYFDQLATWLQSEPGLERVAVIGHVAAGEAEELALARATAVVSALTARGVASARLMALSAGHKPAPAWAAIQRPAFKDRSVRFRAFRVRGRDYFMWKDGREISVDTQ